MASKAAGIIGTIKNSVSLITGGASGLGKATAERFVRLGGRVVICDLPNSNGQKVQEELGSNCYFVPTNILEEKDVDNAVETAMNVFQGIDNVVNCAGIGVAKKLYNFKLNEPHELDLFNKVLMTNVSGTFNVIRKTVGHMNKNAGNEDKQRGVIIMTSSIAAFEGQRGQVAYSASKGAIAAMTLPLARDLSVRGIRVVTIAPGVFLTPLLEGLPEKVKKELGAQVPFPPRLGHPDEFAHMCQTVIENPMLNGEVIRLDGGLRMLA